MEAEGGEEEGDEEEEEEEGVRAREREEPRLPHPLPRSFSSFNSSFFPLPLSISRIFLGMDRLQSLASVEKLSFPRDQQIANHREELLICPSPVRISPRTPVDSINRFAAKTKSLLVNRKDPASEVLSKILSKEEIDDDADNDNYYMGFFCGSPPVRTDNPLINDVQFLKQATSTDAATAAFASPLGGKPLGWGERFPSCGSSSSFAAKPKHMVRIEGFPSTLA